MQIEMPNSYENNDALTVIPASEPESSPPAGGANKDNAGLSGLEVKRLN